MTKKIFRSIFVVAVAVWLLCLVLIMGVLYDYYSSVQINQLKTELSLAAKAVESDGLQYLESLEVDDCRLTWVSADGSVLFDSMKNADEMENHADREEIKEAFEIGIGESSRYSATLTEKTVYYARLMSDGTVLRVSANHASVLLLVVGMIQPILVVVVVALILSAVLAHRLSKRIVEPLNSLDLNKPLENNAYDELSPLLTHIEHQHRQINRQMTELNKGKREFYAVVKNMNEGLVLLNTDDVILSINPAAAAFFSVEADCVGNDFITIERNLDVIKAIETAKTDGHGGVQISKNGREYQLNASRIEDDNKTSGVVILIFDITDKVFAERNRKEFTANVSHELKTPLHSIMGSAELIQSGMVKPEDMPRFVGHIRSESARLVTLIDDIIRLSQLDESDSLTSEKVDLYELAKESISSLSEIAQKKNVSFDFAGEPTPITGVRQLLHEVVYNLCDNAIKYNVDGGKVTVRVSKDSNSGNAVLTVSDTGIGIPPEHQQRVFERFYRVDKSHSKETGGTGLGLSIVKHAVQYMKGKIELESEVGKGTTFTVVIPSADLN